MKQVYVIKPWRAGVYKPKSNRPYGTLTHPQGHLASYWLRDFDMVVAIQSMVVAQTIQAQSRNLTSRHLTSTQKRGVTYCNLSYISHRLRPQLDSMGTTLSCVHSPTETSIDVAGLGRAYLNARTSHRIKGGLAS